MLACVVGLPGCATLFTDDNQSMVIASDPPGATCQIREGGDYVATVASTPATILLHKSRHDVGIDCVRAGYYPGAAVLQPHFQDWTLGNVFFGYYGGNLGLLVDTTTGAVNEYPRWVAVMMKRRPVPGESADETRRLSEIETARQHALRERIVRQ